MIFFSSSSANRNWLYFVEWNVNNVLCVMSQKSIPIPIQWQFMHTSWMNTHSQIHAQQPISLESVYVIDGDKHTCTEQLDTARIDRKYKPKFSFSIWTYMCIFCLWPKRKRRRKENSDKRIEKRKKKKKQQQQQQQ